MTKQLILKTILFLLSISMVNPASAHSAKPTDGAILSIREIYAIQANILESNAKLSGRTIVLQSSYSNPEINAEASLEAQKIVLKTAVDNFYANPSPTGPNFYILQNTSSTAITKNTIKTKLDIAKLLTPKKSDRFSTTRETVSGVYFGTPQTFDRWGMRLTRSE